MTALPPVAGPLWAVDDCRWSDGVLAFDGWTLTAATAGEPQPRLGGRAPDAFESLPAPAFARALAGHAPGCAAHAHRVRFATTPDERARPRLELRLAGADGRPIAGAGLAFPGDGQPEARLPLPGPEHIGRIGRNDPVLFRLLGASTADRVRALAAAHGAAIGRQTRVLDWGCGCGRTARFFTDVAAYTGADVDGFNVDWCRAHLPGRWVTLPLHPPTPLQDHAFDLVFGLSVMTHLDAPVRAAWLVELARVTAPGGLALLTVLGPTGAASEPLTADEASAYARDGHCFKRLEHTIGAAVGAPAYYGNAFVTHAHLRATWSAAFDVVAIVPAEVGFRQDVVVLRKRPGGS
jgi:SAM-dependent methyltransferase